MNGMSNRVSPANISWQPDANGFVTATDLAVKRKQCMKISTGSKQLDSILLGYDYWIRHHEVGIDKS